MKNLTSDFRPETLRHMQAELTRRLAMPCTHCGFRPAFYDYATCTLYASRHADGRPAWIHDFDGLPDELVVVRTDGGRVIAVKSSLMTGFERNGYFFTIASALRAAQEWGVPS